MAGKTGTTENYGDAWFVGYTPQLAVAVWVGYPDRLEPMETEFEGDPVAGGTFPALIWRTFAERALDHLEEPPESFPYPSYESVVARQVVYPRQQDDARQRQLPGLATDSLLRRHRAERRGRLQAERGRRPRTSSASRLAAAKDQLYSMPLTPDVVWRPARPGERLGFVIDQKPESGTLSSWSTVRIVLPRAGNGRVPDVVGLDARPGRAAGWRDACSASSSTYVDGGHPDVVIAQFPQRRARGDSQHDGSARHRSRLTQHPLA